MFTLTGSRIQITGSGPANGVYLVPVNPALLRVKVSRIATNQSGRITGIVPDSSAQFNKIAVQTQYTGQNTSSVLYFKNSP